MYVYERPPLLLKFQIHQRCRTLPTLSYHTPETCYKEQQVRVGRGTLKSIGFICLTAESIYG